MNQVMAQRFKALSDENRLVVLQKLIEGQSCGCTLIHEVAISQPTLSYHLNLLESVGLTVSQKEGTWKKHQVQLDVLDEMIVFLEQLKKASATSCAKDSCHV